MRYARGFGLGRELQCITHDLTPTVAGALLFALLAAIAAEARQTSPLEVNVPESFARKTATVATTPTFPVDAIAGGKHGVVVAELRIGRDGKTVQVRILESPDPELATAVQDAARTWEFAPVQVRAGDDRLAVIANTKLTFYFSVVDGKGVVRGPELPTAPDGVGGRLIEVRQQEFDRLLEKTGTVLLVDIRDRDEYRLGHRPNAQNIPADELQARAQELIAGVVVIDCLDPVDELCPLVAKPLSQRLGKDVYLLRR